MHPYEFDTDRRGRVASAALDIALDAIIVIDRGGAVVEWNPSAEATFQWRRREAVGRPIADLIIPPHLREAHLEGLSRFLTTGAGPALDRRLTLPGVRKDGTELVVELTISTLESAGEQLFVGWLRDVTEFIEARLETERASLRFVALAQSLADGVLFVDSRQEIVFVNQAFCDLFGLDTAPDDLAGRPTSAIRPTADALVADAAGFGREIVRRVEGGERVLADEIRLGDGRTLERDYTPVVLPDDAPRHLWLYRDISQRRELEEAQARVLGVERTLRENAEQQALAFRSAAELKTEIVAKVSHELRTPLTAIVSLADQLVDDLGADEAEAVNSGELRRFASVIARNGERLGRLVDDLILLGQLESGALSIERSFESIPEIISRAVFNLTHTDAGHMVHVRSDLSDGPPCFVDSHRIEQVVENLLSNAAKFTGRAGSIHVTALYEHGAWTVQVSDDGVGVPVKEQDALFDSFFRATTSGSVPGTGLGLAISRSIVELHGGTITVASEPGEGATFTFTIPDGQGQ